jgi:hypothetical protein
MYRRPSGRTGPHHLQRQTPTWLTESPTQQVSGETDKKRPRELGQEKFRVPLPCQHGGVPCQRRGIGGRFIVFGYVGPRAVRVAECPMEGQQRPWLFALLLCCVKGEFARGPLVQAFEGPRRRAVCPPPSGWLLILASVGQSYSSWRTAPCGSGPWPTLLPRGGMRCVQCDRG